MKKKILTVSIALILIAIFACLGLFMTMPKNVADASDEAFYLFEEDPNHTLGESLSVISNKQIGLYIHPFNFTKDIKLVYINTMDDSRVTLTNEITMFPIKNNITYYVCATHLTDKLSAPLVAITYDIELPFISAETRREQLKNNSTVIAEQVTIKAHDNFTDLKMFVSINDSVPQQCENLIYQITEEGAYKFYAVDVAGNYSEDFTITYYKQEPTKEPDEPIVPDEPITPTNPITPEEPIMDSENTTSQDGGIIAFVVIVAVVIVGIVAVIVYRKVKIKATMASFDDDE